MTNREAHEEASGMALDDMFFIHNGIDPDAEVKSSGEELDEHIRSICSRCNKQDTLYCEAICPHGAI